MRCGIIGLPQVGKTTVFRLLTGTAASEIHRHGAGAPLAVIPMTDERLDRLARLFASPKVTYATLEYVDAGAVGKELLQESAYLASLHALDALLHVVRVFADDTIPHLAGSVDPQRDVRSVEQDLILSDMAVAEHRRAKLEKDRKKIKSEELEKEHELLQKVLQHLESESPLRTAAWGAEESKRLRGFAFLSQKPLLVVLNVGEEQIRRIGQITESVVQALPEKSRHVGVTSVSGKIEAELAGLPESDAAEFRSSYGLGEPGRDRLLRATREVLGLIVFFTVSEKECRAWNLPRGSSVLQAAGTVHSDLGKHFIRAEVISWETLVETGDLSEARHKGVLRIEGKDYVVEDGEVIYIRHGA